MEQEGVSVDAPPLWGTCLQYFSWNWEVRLPWFSGSSCTTTSSSSSATCSHIVRSMHHHRKIHRIPRSSFKMIPSDGTGREKISSKQLELLPPSALTISPPHQHLPQQSWDQNTPELMHKHQSVCGKSALLTPNTQMESDVICVPIQASLGCRKLNPSLVRKEGGKSSLLVTRPT